MQYTVTEPRKALHKEATQQHSALQTYYATDYVLTIAWQSDRITTSAILVGSS